MIYTLCLIRVSSFSTTVLYKYVHLRVFQKLLYDILQYPWSSPNLEFWLAKDMDGVIESRVKQLKSSAKQFHFPHPGSRLLFLVAHRLADLFLWNYLFVHTWGSIYLHPFVGPRTATFKRAVITRRFDFVWNNEDRFQSAIQSSSMFFRRLPSIMSTARYEWGFLRVYRNIPKVTKYRLKRIQYMLLTTKQQGITTQWLRCCWTNERYVDPSPLPHRHKSSQQCSFLIVLRFSYTMLQIIQRPRHRPGHKPAHTCWNVPRAALSSWTKFDIHVSQQQVKCYSSILLLKLLLGLDIQTFQQENRERNNVQREDL